MATLLKAWFRECPDPLLAPLTMGQAQGQGQGGWLAKVAAMTDLEEVGVLLGDCVG